MRVYYLKAGDTCYRANFADSCCEYACSGNRHGVGCSYDPTGSCRSQEEVDLGFQIETGQDENQDLQPELFGEKVPTYSMIKAMRPAGHLRVHLCGSHRRWRRSGRSRCGY